MNQLTHQEQKIVALIAQGLTNKEIAQRLGSSPFTVRNQVKVIMRKLELKNRTQVVYLIDRNAILLSGIAKLQKLLLRPQLLYFKLRDSLSNSTLGG
jgi:DNA-binding CsgD family transcriptional regulator